jgi:integrase
MGVYKRKLNRGIRWYYAGQFSGTRYHSRAIYHTKQEAKRAEAERIKEIDEETRNPIKDMLLMDLMSERLDYIKATKSHDYYKENHRYYKNAIIYWGNPHVSEITKAKVNDYLMKEAGRLKSNGKTNHKVNSLIRSLKALFNYGIRIHDLNIRNPINGVGFYPINISLKYIPKDEEIESVKSLCNAEQNSLIDFVDETACRIMEAVRLKADDADGDLITLWTRKSKNSDLVPRRLPKPMCLKIRGEGRIFAGWNSYPRFLKDAVNKSKLKSWNWHNLRHRRASIWASNGMNTFEIMTRLGHSNLQTTMRYLQLLGFTRI